MAVFFLQKNISFCTNLIFQTVLLLCKYVLSGPCVIRPAFSCYVITRQFSLMRMTIVLVCG